MNLIHSTSEPLIARATRVYPDSPANQAKWVRAVMFLRRKNQWIMDKGGRLPKWQAGNG